MQVINHKEQLLDLLAQGATVLTPNNRLSAALLEQYFGYMNQATVQKPSCLPYNTAIQQAYQRVLLLNPQHPHPLVLNQAQTQHLWRTVIQQEESITYSAGLLNAVMEAWEHCEQWQIDPENSEFCYTAQTRQFQLWWQAVNKKSKQLGALSAYQLLPYLLGLTQPVFTQEVIWVCFDDFNPQQQSLQAHLTAQGLTQYSFDLPDNASQPSVLEACDNQAETQQLMHWLQQRLQLGEKRIGVVVPDLQTQARRFQRVLQNHFDPSLFNISLGQSLSEFPLVAHALCLLTLDTKQLSAQDAMLLLQSPYLGMAKGEFLARSQYLQEANLLQEQTIPLAVFIQDLSQMAPELSTRLNLLCTYPDQASPEEWINLLIERLNALGFPGDYGLDSENYQCFNRFTALLDELRQFEVISPSLTAFETLTILKSLADNTIFQAQKTNAPIQVSGLLEASGGEFESLWVMGMTDQALPQKTRLSAFIPPLLQRSLFMPHCLPERELKFASQTIQRLVRGSPATVFSYAKLQGDSPNLPCSLIAHFPTLTLPVLANKTSKAIDLFPMEESYLLARTANEQTTGGTALLANQAKCPFKAFAAHRLAAKPLLPTTDGLDNLERGKIIHKIMELLWKALGSQANLLQLSAQALDLHIDQAIHQALDPVKQLHPESFPPLIKEVEFTRLKRQVLDSLAWEKQRPPFTVLALEESYTINLAGLELSVRVDRLDTVDQHKWVIDYKSSLPASKPWNEDRPKEPQLLLYALLDEQINTLLFMQLKSGKLLCSGISEEKPDLTGIGGLKKGESWETNRATWREQLTLLADEFQQGHCPPQPASLGLCQQCDFQNLCRFQATE